MSVDFQCESVWMQEHIKLWLEQLATCSVLEKGRGIVYVTILQIFRMTQV